MSTITAPRELQGNRASLATHQPAIAMAMAMDRNQLIGKEGGLPWRVPGELAHFKALTMGKPIIMGRRTFESIGRPLPGRTNIVVTRDRRWHAADADELRVAHSLSEGLSIGAAVAMDAGTPADEIVVIGGATLCTEAMPLTQRLYLTVIDHAFEGDTWLDSFVESDWKEIARQEPDPASAGGYSVAYRVLERKS